MSLSATNLSESGFYDFSFNLLHLKEADEKKVNEEEKKEWKGPTIMKTASITQIYDS